MKTTKEERAAERERREWQHHNDPSGLWMRLLDDADAAEEMRAALVRWFAVRVKHDPAWWDKYPELDASHNDLCALARRLAEQKP